jgi:hypothetical protein
MPNPPLIIGDLKSIQDLDKKFEINPNIIPYLEYKQDLNMYKNGGLGGTNYNTFSYGKKTSGLTEKDKKEKSNYIPNTGDPYIDAAAEYAYEADQIEKELADIGNDFAKKGKDGWYRPDERFEKLVSRLQTLLNIITALAMLMEAKHESEKSVLLFMQPKESRAEEGESHKQKSLLEMVSSSADKHAKASAQLAKGLSDYITKLNNDRKKILLEQAQKDAWRESQHWYNDLGDFFGIDSTKREFNERFAKKKEAIEKEFKKVQKEITRIFEKFKMNVAQAIKRDKSDPFAQKMAEVMDKTNESSLIKDAGSGYQDINKDNAYAHTKWFLSLQNTRTAYYKIKMAKVKLRDAILKKQTGIEHKGNFDQAFSKIMSDATILERYFFVSYLNQVQTQIAAHNEYVTAVFEREKAEEMNSFWSSVWFCALPIGGLLIFSSLHVKLADWIRLEAFYATHDNHFTPSELNMDNVYKIIDELADTQMGLSKKTVDRVQKFFNEMEKKILELEKELSKKGTMSAPDSMKAVNWNFINKINEQYELIQRIVHGVLTLLLSKAKLASSALKQDDVPDVGWVKDAIKSTFKNNRLALDFKIDTIRKKVEEHNRQRAQELELDKARYGIAGGIAGVVLAVALIAANVVTFGAASVLTVLAYAGFIAACSAAGSALGELTFQYSHPVHENVYGEKNFYKEILEAETQYNKMEDSLDRIRQRQRKNIDKINSNSFIDAGRDKRALDIKAVIRARNELTRDRIIELAILMVAKTKANIRAAMSARVSGRPAILADFDGLQASMEADYNGLLNAFEYKVLMANDEINLHNAKIDQEKALSDAWVSFGINTVSAVCSAFSGKIGTNGIGSGSSYSKLIDVKAYGKLAANARLDATQVVLRTYDLLRAYEHSQAKYGMLIEDTRRLNELINDIYSMTQNVQDNNMRKALREAAKTANINLVEGIGDGRVAINMKYLFRILRKVESIYNAEIARAMIENAKNQARAKMTRSISAGNEVVDALYQDMDRAKAVVQHLYQRLEDYVKFVNAVAEAKKQLVMKAAAFAVFAVMKTDQVLDGKITDGITKGVNKALGKVLGKFFRVKNAENLSFKVPLHDLSEKLLSLIKLDKWVTLIPKELNLNDIVGMAVRILLSENMAQRIALLATKQAEKGLDKKAQDVPEGPKSEAPAESGDASANALDRLDHEVALAEERMGDTGLSEAKFEVSKFLEVELKNFLMQIIREMPQDYKAARNARWRRPEGKHYKQDIAKKAKKAKVAPPPAAEARQREVAVKDFKKIDKNTSVLQQRVKQLLLKVERQLKAVKQSGDKPVDIKKLKDELARLRQELKKEEGKIKLLMRELESLKSKQNILQKQIVGLSAKLSKMKKMLDKEDSKLLKELKTLSAKLEIMRGGNKVNETKKAQKKSAVKDGRDTVQKGRREIASILATINITSKEQEKDRKKRKFDPTNAVAAVLAGHQRTAGISA